MSEIDETIPDVYRIDMFYDGNTKIHSKKSSKEYDKNWVVSVKGNIRASQERQFFGKRIEVSPLDSDDTLSCYVDKDNEMIVCKIEKSDADDIVD